VRFLWINPLRVGLSGLVKYRDGIAENGHPSQY